MKRRFNWLSLVLTVVTVLLPTIKQNIVASPVAVNDVFFLGIFTFAITNYFELVQSLFTLISGLASHGIKKGINDTTTNLAGIGSALVVGIVAAFNLFNYDVSPQVQTSLAGVLGIIIQFFSLNYLKEESLPA